MPRTLDETYERILVNIPKEFQSKAINALKWIIYCKFHPFLDELADAIVINHDADPPFNLGDRLSDPSRLLEILPGLITTEGPLDTPQIAHFSVVEYLASARIVDGPANIFHVERSKAIISITKDCFDILKSYAHPINQKLLGDNTRAFSPLEQHAWRHWADYIELLDTPIDPELSCLVVDFAVNFDSIQQRHHYKLPPTPWSRALIKSPCKPLDSGLYAALAHCRAENIAMIFLDAGANVDFQEGDEGTALQLAVRKRMPKIIRMLLDAGADANLVAKKKSTALQSATVNGGLECVKLLLDAGAHVNSQAGMLGTPLHNAATCGNLEMVKLLLGAGADVNVTSRKYSTALQVAARGNEVEIVRVLLGAGADVNWTGGIYGTALQAARMYDDEQVIDMLLKAGAE